MKIKTSEATPLQLNWLAAKCEAVEVEYINDGITRCLLRVSPFTGRYSPSTDWSQGGPIIEREKIGIWPSDSIEGMWASRPDYEVYPERLPPSYGPTPLIAAMRCFCASNLGEEVEIPEELANL